MSRRKVIRAIDLCCGAGGWAIATRGLPIQIVAAFDFAWDCCLTYRYNNPDAAVACMDVTRLDWSRFRDIDLLLGAIPCEEISVSRNSQPVASLDKWHGLLDSVLAGVDEINPRYWVIENVIQMRKHLPPLTPYVIMNSAHWSGQARKRIFVGRFPIPEPGDAKTLGDYLRPGPYILQECTLRCEKISGRQWYTENTKRLLQPEKPSPVVTDFGSRHSRGFMVPLKEILSPEEPSPTVTEATRTNWRANHGPRVLLVDQPAPTVRAQNRSQMRQQQRQTIVAESDGRERALQFTEAAALQGFPDDYVFVASQSRAWKMVAQAVQIETARAILQAITGREQGSTVCV